MNNGKPPSKMHPIAPVVWDVRSTCVTREMGDGLKDYGESIYDTRGGPFPPGSWAPAHTAPTRSTCMFSVARRRQEIRPQHRRQSRICQDPHDHAGPDSYPDLLSGVGLAVSNTMDVGLWLRAWEQALTHAGCALEMFNTDQGGPFTASEWSERLQAEGVKISMEGRAVGWTTCSSSGCGGA